MDIIYKDQLDALASVLARKEVNDSRILTLGPLSREYKAPCLNIRNVVELEEGKTHMMMMMFVCFFLFFFSLLLL